MLNLSMVECRGTQLVYGSCGACLDSMLPGVQVTAGLGFFLHSSHLSDSEDCDPLPQA